MPKWIKRLIAVAIGAALVYLAAARIYEIQQQQSAPQAKKKGGSRVVSVDLAKAEVGTLRESLLLTGSLKPKEAVDISPKSQGRVVKLYFQVGDRVRAGDLVAELDDDELEQQVNRAEASLAVTRASLEQRRAERDNAEAELARAKQLFEDGLLSPQDYESQKTSLAVFNAQVQLAGAQQQQAEAELRELRIRLGQTKVYSPLDGYCANRYVDEGALVSPTTPVLRVVNLSTMVTLGNVPERNIGKLRVGNQTIVYVDALPNESFVGRVARISPVLDAATRSALIEIDIPNPERVLKAEMFARIELDLGTTRETTLIPRDGLVYRGEQPGVYVVEEEDRPVFRAIETGLTREGKVEVLANLDPGTVIVGRGATMLRDGDRIAVAGAGKKGGGKGAKKGAEPKTAAESRANANSQSSPSGT